MYVQVNNIDLLRDNGSYRIKYTQYLISSITSLARISFESFTTLWIEERNRVLSPFDTCMHFKVCTILPWCQEFP